MTVNGLVQSRIDPSIKERASLVLDKMGLTVSDAVRILLTRIANEGALPPGLIVDQESHDVWFRAKVREAMEDTEPPVEHKVVEAQFAARRAATRKKIAESEP